MFLGVFFYDFDMLMSKKYYFDTFSIKKASSTTLLNTHLINMVKISPTITLSKYG